MCVYMINTVFGVYTVINTLGYCWLRPKTWFSYRMVEGFSAVALIKSVRTGAFASKKDVHK